MKIPHKIDKRTHTRLSKLNAKYLNDELFNVNHDLKIEIDFLVNHWNIENRFMNKEAEEHKDTVKFWHKEMNTAFKQFKRDKIKIDKALARGIEHAKKLKDKNTTAKTKENKQ